MSIDEIPIIDRRLNKQSINRLIINLNLLNPKREQLLSYHVT